MNVLRLNAADRDNDILPLFAELITEMSCSLRAESQILDVKVGSRLHALYRAATTSEKYNCGYTLNDSYREAFEHSELKCVAHNRQGDVRAVELLGHQFFLAALFQPQLSSTELHPHPLIVAFLEAAKNQSQHLL